MRIDPAIKIMRSDLGRIGWTEEDLNCTRSDMYALRDLGLVGRLEDGRWFGLPEAFLDGEQVAAAVLGGDLF